MCDSSRTQSRRTFGRTKTRSGVRGPLALTSRESYSFSTLVDLLNDELGTDIEPEYVANPIPVDVYVHDTCADPTKILEATGWEPQVTFEDGLRHVCAQYTE